jgi:hypothetical protein
MMVGLYYVTQDMGIFPMSVANNFCDMPLPKYPDSKTVLIYLPHPVHTPPLAKMQIETRLGGNRTSASDLRSEAIDWARGGCGDHFGLFRASVRGQAAELEASAGQPLAFLKMLL